MINLVKNNIFKAIHFGKGYPVVIRGRKLRIDESLRRFKADSETTVQEVLESHLPGGGLFVDIGANFGLHTLFACDLMGPTGKVLAVEPVPANIRLLKRNITLNDFTERCSIAELALTDGSSKRVRMTIDPGLSLAASLSQNSNGAQIDVNATTLDEILGDSFPVPSLIKIDVEGAEHDVLKGARKLLNKRPPLLIEVHRYELASFGSSAEALVSYLQSYGYKEERLDEISGALGGYHHSLFR